MQDKILEYEKRLEKLECEVAGLRQQLDVMKGEAQPTSVRMDNQQTVFYGHAGHQQRDSSVPSQLNPSVHTNRTQVNRRADMEKTVGKIFMGVFASVLIFISMILFATLVIAYLDDNLKMLLSYVVSFLFLGLGLFMLRKSVKNCFWLAFAGCGAGGIYISLLLSNVYYQVLGDIGLFVLVGVWAGLMCCLSRLKSHLFRIIGHIGITIAVAFGQTLCIRADDVSKFTALVIFYLITSGIFLGTHFEKSFSKNKVYHIFNFINIGMLYFGYASLFQSGISLVGGLLFLLLLGSIAVSFYTGWQESNISHGLIISVYGILTAVVCQWLVPHRTGHGILVYVIAVTISVLAQIKKGRSEEGKYVIQVVMILVAHVILDSSFLREHAYLFLITLPMVIAGFKLGSSLYKWGAVLTFIVGTCKFQPEIADIVGGMFILILLFGLLWKYKEQYAVWTKTAIYVAACLFIVVTLRNMLFCHMDKDYRSICRCIVFACIAGFNLYMMKGRFSRNIKTKEEETNLAYYIVNVLIMVYGLYFINHLDNELLHLLAIMITIVVFLANAKRLLDMAHSIFPGIYVGMKLTILIVVILKSFDTVSYFVSITCFAVALVSIVTGFVAKYKSLRIYGLVLSMFSIVKLIMIDVHYSNTLGNAISFFVCGVLCFGISLVYNYFDKKLMTVRHEQNIHTENQ